MNAAPRSGFGPPFTNTWQFTPAKAPSFGKHMSIGAPFT